ncbi:MAG: VOC family protein [Chloroflexota bacterium]|jgi:lactoylglutathione lyase
MDNPLDYTFDHVHVFCTDLSKTERWFIDCLGAELIRRRELHGAPATDVRLAGVDIFLRGPMPGEIVGQVKRSQFGTDHFGLRVRDLDATIAELKRRGAEFDAEPRWVNPKLKIIFVKGPDDIRIELLQREA